MRQIAAARPCAWCGSRRARLVWVEAGYRYVRCRSCGGVFSDLTESDYERARHNVWNEALPDDATVAFYGAARERAHAEFLDNNPPAGNRRLLDIGCGLGFFLARAQERGWDVYGVDSSRTWVGHANSLLGAERVEEATVERASHAPGSLALITAWDVIEHIFDPVPFLAHLRTLLAPGGRLFIRTPNLAYVYPVYAVRRWLLGHDVELGPTNHVVYFTAHTMRDALARAGLRPSNWPALLPPQVALAPNGRAVRSRREHRIIAAKNGYARAVGALAGASGGKLVAGGDLDVLCAPADRRCG
ncbi:MAG: methyltransferase domain-containing protein [Actinomycetota bacterium]|nr:methyltransferase domain-containing protein [Actinomycetota bacterium]